LPAQADPLPLPGFVRSLFEQIGHPLRWRAVDKCLATVTIAIPLYLSSYILILYVRAHPERLPYYNHEFLPFYLRWHEVVIAGWLILGAVGLYQRQKERDSQIYAAAACQYGCITTAIFMYFPGYSTSPYLMGILGAGIMVFMFFTMRQALWGLFSLLTIYTGLTVLIAAGIIPEGPLLSGPPYENGRISVFWVVVNSSICLMLAVLMVIGVAFVVYQWHDRQARLDELSRTDPLTGLANRRHFFRTLRNELARAVRLGRPISLILCDTDKFKQINDTHGHQAGDEVLTRIAAIMEGSLRTGIDTAGRIGGDEFAILLSETGIDGAKALAGRILDAVRRESFDRNGASYSTSLSIGAIACDEDIPELDTLVEAADLLLYRAKNEGRNRIVAAPVSEIVPRPQKA